MGKWEKYRGVNILLEVFPKNLIGFVELDLRRQKNKKCVLKKSEA